MGNLLKIQKDAGYDYELTFANESGDLGARLNHLGVPHRLYIREEYHLLAQKSPYSNTANVGQKSHVIVAAFQSEETMNFVRLTLGGVIEAYKRM